MLIRDNSTAVINKSCLDLKSCDSKRTKMKLPSFFRRSKSDYFEGAVASADSQPHPQRKKRREELRERLNLDSTYDRRKRKLN